MRCLHSHASRVPGGRPEPCFADAACRLPPPRRYQEASDNLSLQTLRLNEELEAQKQNLKDINEFLTNELKARTLTASALEQKLNELQAAFETAKKNHEVRLRALCFVLSLPSLPVRFLGRCQPGLQFPSPWCPAFRHPPPSALPSSCAPFPGHTAARSASRSITPPRSMPTAQRSQHSKLGTRTAVAVYCVRRAHGSNQPVLEQAL